ncbi:probable O-methyltransferase 3 [Vigna radiata var. radiata]|uniref:Probable O-methyltransferase 3 n=1 Tax=Vigna radiata var. radiata TaxID=3916 RepID=A0A1S3UAL0_VIGRR|nr:probable O-methyltransferase 3 [Vigna radiata var. radiata]
MVDSFIDVERVTEPTFKVPLDVVYAGCNRKVNHLFNDAMENDTRLISSLMIEKCKGTFTRLKSLVDVGGGTGTMAKAIAKSFPKMQCIVLDLPHVVAGLQGAENLKYVGGDMFEAIPPADSILLKWIMHDWSDEECMKILKKCKEAIRKEGKKGKVIIIETVMDDEKRDDDDEFVETQLLFDILMMGFFVESSHQTSKSLECSGMKMMSDSIVISENLIQELIKKTVVICLLGVSLKETCIELTI